jgi:MoaA/NifB/PqqE/SkfB family radical SAM enzyme
LTIAWNILKELPIALPAMGINAYMHERELRFDFEPRCFDNYQEYLSAKKNQYKDKINYLPIKLDIENVSRCNFRCTMCSVSDFPKGKRADDLPLKDFKKIIDEQYGLMEIKLQGLGEPTLQRDDFFEMIKYARARHIWVRTTTNASLLHLNGNARKLVESNVNEIQISVDGASKEVFERIRRGSHYPTVIRNINLINRIDNSRTKMWTVVQKDNNHELERLVDTAHNLGFKNQVFSMDIHGWGDEKWEKINAEATMEINENRLLDLVNKGRELGVTVAFWLVGKKYTQENPCSWPFERLFVGSDKRTSPCCIIGNPDTMSLGKINNSLTEDVWHSKDYEQFRKDHLSGNIPPACKFCYKGQTIG